MILIVEFSCHFYVQPVFSYVLCYMRNVLILLFLLFLRRGSVVRTSVFGWRTFHDLCLIYGWHVTTSWVRCLLWVNQPGNLAFYPSGVGKWVSNLCNYISNRSGDH